MAGINQHYKMTPVLVIKALHGNLAVLVRYIHTFRATQNTADELLQNFHFFI